MEQVLFHSDNDSLSGDASLGNGRNPLIFQTYSPSCGNKMLPQARIYKAVTTNGLVPANKSAAEMARAEINQHETA
jgi:hypothetical protein